MLHEGYNYFIHPTIDEVYDIIYEGIVIKRLYNQDMEVSIEIVVTFGLSREIWDNVESREHHYTCYRINHGHGDDDLYDLIIWVPKGLIVNPQQLSVSVVRYYPETNGLQFIADHVHGFQISEYEDLNIVIDLEERKEEYPDDVE